MNIKKFLVGASAGAIMLGGMAVTVFAVSSFFNGFETDTTGWFDDGINITRVASGTNGITSATGSYHAEVQADAFTRWGEYESAFPTNGYVTQVEIYLDMSQNPTIGTDKRFDFSSAINRPDDNHRRDFIFNVGTDPLVAGQFAMSASNNAPGWPSNPGRSPFFVKQSGWYTFRHTFKNNAGTLGVVMDVLNHSGTVLHSWTLSDPSDLIGTTVGGNRYGWFVDSAFSFLAIDNSEKFDIVPVVGPPVDKNECKNDGWKTFNNPTFKNQGACVSYVVSNEHAGKRLQTFTATDSLYYNCADVCGDLYGTGRISFTWDPITGNVMGGYYNEIVPPNTGTTYYNIVTGGSVIGGTVNLTFNRTIPNVYGPFSFTGTLSDNVLTGTLDGPYYFTATGTVTP